ncbi:MAG: hypothetical protein K1X57_11575 [Gemmataceae bacterium]|nr:hypothetical protein [Gemmataceae bacterium]
MMMKSARIAMICLFFAATGCGASQSKITGKVTFKTKPLICGSVQFVIGDSTFESPIGTDGSYSIPNAKTGEAKIAVVSNKPVPVDPRAAGRGGASGATPPDPAQWFAIPDKYNDIATSGKTATVKGGPNTINIDLD